MGSANECDRGDTDRARGRRSCSTSNGEDVAGERTGTGEICQGGDGSRHIVGEPAAEEQVDELFRELFGDDGDCVADAAASGSPKEIAEAEMGDDEATRDGNNGADEGEHCTVSGSRCGEEKNHAGRQGSGDEKGEEDIRQGCESHPDDEFQEFLRDRKRVRRQYLDTRGGDVVAGSSGKGSTASAKVRLDVQKYVGELLEPWLKGGSISVRQFTDILGRVVEKVMTAHAGAVDSCFLEGHATSIRKLVDRYVRLTVKC